LLYISVAMKVVLALAFPLILLALGFYDERERRRLAGIWQQALGALRNRKPDAKPQSDAEDLPISPEKSFDAGD
jgi:hypothetical protein